MRGEIVPHDPVELNLPPGVDDLSKVPNAGPRNYIGWSKLLSLVWEIDPLQCPCGGRLRLIALIEDPHVIKKILAHVGLPTKRPVLSPARDPPNWN